jgi:hypothetical protein
VSKIVDIEKLSFCYSFCLSAVRLMTACVAAMLFPEKSLSFVPMVVGFSLQALQSGNNVAWSQEGSQEGFSTCQEILKISNMEGVVQCTGFGVVLLFVLR